MASPAPVLNFPGKTTAVPSTVHIFVIVEDRNVLAAKIDRSLIVKHSKTVKSLLEANPGKNDVVLKSAAKGPVEHVLEFMKKGKQPLRIGVSHETLERAVAILQAINALDVEPPQPQIENYVIYQITQFKITAVEVKVIGEAADRLGTESRPYKAIVQGVAYGAKNGGFSAEETKAIKAVTTQYPTLDAAITKKFLDLKERTREHEKMLEEKKARKERQAAREAREYGC